MIERKLDKRGEFGRLGIGIGDRKMFSFAAYQIAYGHSNNAQ